MDGRTDGQTDGRTDRQTNGPTKRVVESRSTRLKKKTDSVFLHSLTELAPILGCVNMQNIIP